MIERVYSDRFHVVRADGPSVVYSKDAPRELLETGEAVNLFDFHQGAASVGTTRTVGTRMYKETLIGLIVAERATDTLAVEAPFNLIGQTRPSRPKAHGVCTNYGYTQVWLDDFYIRTQSLYDYFERLTKPVAQHGLKGSLVLQV